MVDHATVAAATAGQVASMPLPQQLEQQQQLSGHPAAMPHTAAARLGVPSAAEGIVPDPKRQICFDFTKNQCR